MWQVSFGSPDSLLGYRLPPHSLDVEGIMRGVVLAPIKMYHQVFPNKSNSIRLFPLCSAGAYTMNLAIVYTLMRSGVYLVNV